MAFDKNSNFKCRHDWQQHNTRLEEWKREKKTRENTRRKSAISNQSVGSSANLEDFLTTPGGIDNRRRGSAYVTGKKKWKKRILIKY